LNYCQFLIFSDDIQLFLKMSYVYDCLHLQEDFNEMVLWTNKLGLSLNISKCHTM